jgi:hypothetical protein
MSSTLNISMLIFKRSNTINHGFQMLTLFALLLRDVSCSLQVIESEDVLEFSLIVNNGAASLLLALLQEVNQELFNVLWLFIANNSGQVLTI